MEAASPTVFVVDDDRAVRDSLRWLIESVGLRVEAFESPREFFDSLETDPPGCLVLDVRLPEVSGLEVQERLAARGVRMPVIMISAFGDVPTAVRAMKGGAADFLEKPFNDQALLDRIQQCLEADARNRLEDAQRSRILERMATLTRREHEVMELLVGGRSTKLIARELAISAKTVEVHRANVMKKMQAESIADLVQIALSAASGKASNQ